MILPSNIYNKIVSKIRNHKSSLRDLEDILIEEYMLPPNTVCSIILNENKRKMKKSHYKNNRMSQNIYERFMSLKASGNNSKVMIKLADELNLPYTWLAKVILEKYFNQENNSDVSQNKAINIKQYLKDSTLIEDKDLAYEVFLCQLYDYQYGNINDIIRHSFGQEYEYYLQKIVKEKKLTFKTEDDLRIYGYDKTPDIKLDVPFAVDGFVVNWIESKALFGDPYDHENYIKEQYSSYWNRFGTGLVIYWLGMVDSVIDDSEKRFIVRDDFPQNVTLFDPLVISKFPENFCKSSELH